MLINAREIIKQSFSLYKENGQLFIRYMILLFIPTAIITILGSLLEILVNKPSGLFTILYAIVGITSTLAAFWITLAFIRVVANAYAKKKGMPLRDELRGATSLIWPAIWVSIISALVIFGGLLLFLIPGIIFSIWFSFSLYSVILDNQKGVEALKHSKALVKGRWWQVFWRLLVPGIFFTIILFVAQWIISFPLNAILGSMSPGTIGFTLVLSLLSLVASLFSVIITPLSTAAPTILYMELKKGDKK